MLQVYCPGCQQAVEWSEASPHRPFCSLRCKNDDLCAWAKEEHVVPGDDEATDHFSESGADDR